MVKTLRIKWLLVIGGILFALLVIGAIVLWIRVYYSDNALKTASTTTTAPAKVTAASVCGTSIIEQANTPIANSDQFALGQVVGTIAGLKNYTHDPNCLYIALVYSIATGDATASQTYLNEYTQVYDPAIGLSSSFTVPIMPLTTLKNDVAFLVQNAQNTASQQKDNSAVSSGSDAADKFYQGQKQ